MTTKLGGTLKRELLVAHQPYTLTLSAEGFTLALKGRHKGLDVAWKDLVSGEAALATALNASLKANIQPTAVPPAPRQTGQARRAPAPRRKKA